MINLADIKKGVEITEKYSKTIFTYIVNYVDDKEYNRGYHDYYKRVKVFMYLNGKFYDELYITFTDNENGQFINNSFKLV